MVDQIVLHKAADPIKVKLEKGQRGGVGWEITVEGDDCIKILQECYAIDGLLRKQYADNLGTVKEG